MVIDYFIQPQDNKPCSKAKKIAILADYCLNSLGKDPGKPFLLTPDRLTGISTLSLFQ
jgi:hypothetical protein